eukprot:SAG31_NODE_164_length_21790_cov_26.291411_4_plen_149_part_00
MTSLLDLLLLLVLINGYAQVGSTELQVGQISLGMSIRGGLKALVTVHISNLRALHRSPKENGRKSTPASAKFRSSLHTSAFNRSFVLLARIQSAAKKIHIHIEGLDISVCSILRTRALRRLVVLTRGACRIIIQQLAKTLDAQPRLQS